MPQRSQTPFRLVQCWVLVVSHGDNSRHIHAYIMVNLDPIDVIMLTICSTKAFYSLNLEPTSISAFSADSADSVYLALAESP